MKNTQTTFKNLTVFFVFILVSTISFSQTNTLPTSGDVGIGTLTPSAKLDVNGRMIVDSMAVFKDSLRVQKKLIVDQDIKIQGKSVFVGNGKFKNKLVIDGLTRMNGNAKVFGDFKIKSLENTTITENRLLSILPNGKIVVAPITLPPDDTFVCNYTMPWAFANNQNSLTTTSKITLCPNFSDVGIGTTAPLAKLHVSNGNVLLNGRVAIGVPNTNAINNVTDPQLFVRVVPAYDRIAVKMATPQNTSIFFVPKVNTESYSKLSVKNDVGIFWTNDFDGTNSTGLVLAPKTPTGTLHNMSIGMRINESGRFGFNTPVDNQVQYNLQSNSIAGMLINTSNHPAALYGLRLVGNSTDWVISVANPASTLANQGLFTVRGDGSVNIKTSTASFSKPFTITDIPSGKDVFRVLNNGNVYATRVQVKVFTSFPDYVFGSDYNLMPLNQLEEYIKINKHLPNMPTAEKVDEEGLDLAEINRVLVEKVEELTLYMIEMNKRMEIIEAENKRLKN